MPQLGDESALALALEGASDQHAHSFPNTLFARDAFPNTPVTASPTQLTASPTQCHARDSFPSTNFRSARRSWAMSRRWRSPWRAARTSMLLWRQCFERLARAEHGYGPWTGPPREMTLGSTGVPRP